MKSRLIYSMILIAGLVLAGSVNKVYSQTQQNAPAKLQTVKYTRTMYPEIEMDKPGKCPKCGMALVEKKDTKKNEMKCDSTMMKHDHKKMMHDSTSMKKGSMKM